MYILVEVRQYVTIKGLDIQSAARYHGRTMWWSRNKLIWYKVYITLSWFQSWSRRVTDTHPPGCLFTFNGLMDIRVFGITFSEGNCGIREDTVALCLRLMDEWPSTHSRPPLKGWQGPPVTCMVQSALWCPRWLFLGSLANNSWPTTSSSNIH